MTDTVATLLTVFVAAPIICGIMVGGIVLLDRAPLWVSVPIIYTAGIVLSFLWAAIIS
jgi:hypothetical protein